MNDYNKPSFYRIFLSIPLLLIATSVDAEWFEEKKAQSVQEAFEEGAAHVDFRLRYEDIKQGEQGAQALKHCLLNCFMPLLSLMMFVRSQMTIIITRVLMVSWMMFF